jgi:hypothetical protein
MRLRNSLQALANKVGSPAAQLDQPVVRYARGFGAPERERDELDGSADRFDGRVLGSLGAAEFLGRGNGLAMTFGRSRQLPLCFDRGTRPSFCGGHSVTALR